MRSSVTHDYTEREKKKDFKNMTSGGSNCLMTVPYEDVLKGCQASNIFYEVETEDTSFNILYISANDKRVQEKNYDYVLS